MLSHFFAQVARLKLIHRWSLVRNTLPENVAEHTLQVAFIAHALAVIRNRFFGGQLNAERITLLAMYHDISEVITADLPAPVKYHNADITRSYKQLESAAKQSLLQLLPKELQADFSLLLLDEDQNEEERAVVKNADILSAYLKCIEEETTGNKEFLSVKKRLENQLHEAPSAEMDYFLHTFVPSFYLPTDALNTQFPPEKQ